MKGKGRSRQAILAAVTVLAPLIMQMIKRRLQLRKKKILIRLTILQMLNLPLMAAREIS